MGYYDNSGTIVDIYPNGTKYQSIYEGLSVIMKNEKQYLNKFVRGLEFSYTTYDPNIDLFMANYMLVERDIMDNPFISHFDSVGFKTNVYEVGNEKIAEIFDYIRVGLTFLLLMSLFLRIVSIDQNYLQLI